MDLDLHQDIARSSYADMLHDDERNHAYYIAIKTVVKYLVTSQEKNPNGNRFYRCCDIGAGSGLLSMMVAKSFLDLNYQAFRVTAYECFQPMSAIATAVIKANNLSSFIDVHTERVGINEIEDRPQYDLLVAELLDTELIGEGCLEVYRFATEHLCSNECIYIPQEAKIYIEPICSRGLFRRQILRDQAFCLDNKREIIFESDKEFKACPGLSELDDMQTMNLGSSFEFKRFTEPKVAFEIKFYDSQSLKPNDFNRLTFQCDDTLDEEIVIHMWWEVLMYNESLFADYGPPDTGAGFSFSKISVAPTWCRSSYLKKRDRFITKLYKRSIWREHWMQAIYYLPCHEAVRTMVANKNEKGFQFDLYAYRDAYSLWFDLKPCKTPPSCSCKFHRRLNRYEILFLNNSPILRDLITALARSENLDELHISTLEGKLEVNSASDSQTNKWRLDFWYNRRKLNTAPIFSLLDYSLMNDVPWQVLMNRFVDNEDTKPIVSFKIVLNQVAFDALNRIRTRVGHCQGFDLSHLDRLIETSASLADSCVEAHHLWEYECEILGPEIVVFDSEQAKRKPPKSCEIIFTDNVELPLPDLPVERLKAQWALVFSCNIKLSSGKIIKTGCLDCSPGSVKWNHYFKQLVHFLHDHPALEEHDRANSIDLKVDLTRSGLQIVRQNLKICQSTCGDL